MEEEIHQRSVARVAQALVVQVLEPAGKGFAHRSQTAGSGEGFEPNSADIDRLQPFHRRDGFEHAILDYLAIIQILVDHALGRPVEGVAEQAARVLRQRAHSEADRTHAFELFGQIRADDPDEARRQSALRSHDPLRRPGERTDMPGRAHVLGEVEVMEPEAMRRRGDCAVEGKRQTGKDGLAARERSAKRRRLAELDGMRGKRRLGDRARVEARNVEPGVSEELGGKTADLAEAENGDFRGHRAIPAAPCSADRKGCRR
jgi:hypothetical protein